MITFSGEGNEAAERLTAVIHRLKSVARRARALVPPPRAPVSFERGVVRRAVGETKHVCGVSRAGTTR